MRARGKMCFARGVDASRCPFCLAACLPLERAAPLPTLARELSGTRPRSRCLVDSLRRRSSGTRRRFVSIALARATLPSFREGSRPGRTDVLSRRPLSVPRRHFVSTAFACGLWVLDVKSRPGGNCWRRWSKHPSWRTPLWFREAFGVMNRVYKVL